MLTEETIVRLIKRAKSLNMSIDKYINYLMDIKLTGQTYDVATLIHTQNI